MRNVFDRTPKGFKGFQNLKVGDIFWFDGDRFRKETERTAWELNHQGLPVKQWAFHPDDEVRKE